MEAPPKGAQVTLALGGMYCASCVGILESVLGAHAGVLEASVNLATHTGRVIYDPKLTNPAAIVGVVEEVRLTTFRRTYPALGWLFGRDSVVRGAARGS